MKTIDSFIEESRGFHIRKPVPEDKMRAAVMRRAKLLGCEQEAKNIFIKYDDLLRRCSNPIERKHLSITAIAELHQLFDCRGELVINGVEVLPATDDLVEENGILVKKT